MKIAYVRNTFPKNSETFILEEILYLKHAGHQVRIFAKWCDLSNLSNKILENDLLSQVIYDQDAKVPLRKILENVKLFLKNWIRSTQFRQSFRCNFFPDREIKAELSNILTLRCKKLNVMRALSFRIATTFEMWLSAIKFNNLSLARQQIVIRSKEFQPQHIHCPFLFVPDTLKLTELHQAYPDVPFTVTLRSRDVYLKTGNQRYLGARDLLISQATKVFTISNYNKRELSSRFDIRGEMEVIHSSIDAELFSPDFSITKKTNKLICVARLVPKKGVEVLIDACKILKSAGQNFHLSIVGDGPLKPPLLEKIKDLGLEQYVEIIGPFRQRKIKELLAAAEVFVLPCVVAQDGDRDMLPNSLKEALAMNLVTITTNVSGIEELIKDGVNGLLARPNDTKDLAEKILLAISDSELAMKIGAAAREIILEQFSIKSEGKKFNSRLLEINMRESQSA